MPRFVQEEREIINAALLKEGERLFSAFGLKKVTVDDLTEAAGISKGSFYSFYPSKEQLYIEINFGIQEQIYSGLIQVLEDNKSMSPKELTAFAIKEFLKMAEAYPMMKDLDKATMQHLRRKLPAELLDKHTHDDAAMIKMLAGYGIQFSEDIIIVAQALQIIFGNINLVGEDENREKIIDILIGGVVDLVK